MCKYKSIVSIKSKVALSERMKCNKLQSEYPYSLLQCLLEKWKNRVRFIVENAEMTENKFVMKMKQKHREKGCYAILNHQKVDDWMILETDVLFHVKTVDKSKKYMQTVQPFLVDVGYNILGEGQLFIDETAGYAYNVKGLPLLAINWLLNRVDSENTVQEGEAICQH